MRLLAALLATVLTLPAGFQAAPEVSSGAQAPPRDVTFCELAKNPQAFDNARIRITSFINSRFEDFTMWDPTCGGKDSNFGLWLTYGGMLHSGVIYCCPGEGIPRGDELPYPVVIDDRLMQFRAMLKAERDTVIRATVMGTLLLKKEGQGYGHFWGDSLLVIERVEAFDPRRKRDLEHAATWGDYGPSRLKCTPMTTRSELPGSNGDSYWAPKFDGGQRYIEEQRAAERGARAWAFGNPRRVALESARLVSGNTIPSLNRISSTRVKQVFEWRHDGKVTIIVVVRPYWLSFYAATPKVVWVTASMLTESCGIED